MLVTAAASLGGASVKQPGFVMDVVRASIGLMLGAAFTHELLASFAAWWVSLAFLFVALSLMFVAAFFALRRIAGFDKATAALCAMPGGIAEMVLLSEQQGADQARVAIVHALRIAMAILLIPILVSQITTIEPVAAASTSGLTSLAALDWLWIVVCIAAGLLARGRVRMPAPIVVVPMIISAAVHLLGWTMFEVPASITALVQVFIGINVGGRFAGVPMKALMGALGAAAMVVALQIGVAFGGALLVAKSSGADPVALVLAFAPGGLAEMSIIALSVGRDVAFVGLHHVFRVLIALSLAPLLLSWLLKPSGPSK